jgi:hypothetical protein
MDVNDSIAEEVMSEADGGLYIPHIRWNMYIHHIFNNIRTVISDGLHAEHGMRINVFDTPGLK